MAEKKSGANGEATNTDTRNDNEKSTATAPKLATGSDGPTATPVPGKRAEEIRYHPKLPYAYKVTQYNELYTIVERLGIIPEFAGVGRRERLHKLLATYRRLLPLYLKFTKETTTALDKAKMIAYLLGTLSVNLLPAWHTQNSFKLSEAIRQAIVRGRMDWQTLTPILAGELLGYAFQKAMETPMEALQAALGHQFQRHLEEQILSKTVHFDSVTSEDETIQDKVRSAMRLLQWDWRQFFLPHRLSKLAGALCSIFSEAVLLRKMAKKTGNRRITVIVLLVQLVLALRYQLLTNEDYYRLMTANTNPDYLRMEKMAKLGKRTTAQDQLLGLRSYYFTEYQRLKAKLGSVAPAAPQVHKESFRFPMRTRILAFLANANSTIVQLLFGIYSLGHGQGPAEAAAVDLSNLYQLRTSAIDLSGQVASAINVVKIPQRTLRPIENYYNLQDIKPRLKIVEDAVAVPISSDRSRDMERTSSKSSDDLTLVDSEAEQVSPGLDVSQAVQHAAGLKIEFRNVSFTYPHAKHKALDSVSIVVEAGQLCSIVGASGSGKSTLIGLAVRLYDPDEGQVLINDVDVTLLSPEELYKHVSYLFQHTPRTPLTIREFIGLGNLSAMHDQKKIDQAIEDSGADKVISKFKQGLDQDIDPPHVWDNETTVDQLLKRAHMFDDWNWRSGADSTDYGRKGDSEKDDDDDDDTSGKLKDRETMDMLHKVSFAGLGELESSRRTQEACKVALPRIGYKEDEILASDYDSTTKEKSDQRDEMRCSGGEWAKIVLARAFLRRDASLMILDEFSAALDPQSEASIFSKLLDKLGKQTIIAVTHRFHLAAKSQQVIFMEKGKIVEQETHAQLMSLPEGKYRKMYECTKSGNGKDVAVQTGEEVEMAGKSQSVQDDDGSTASSGSESED